MRGGTVLVRRAHLVCCLLRAQRVVRGYYERLLERSQGVDGHKVFRLECGIRLWRFGGNI